MRIRIKKSRRLIRMRSGACEKTIMSDPIILYNGPIYTLDPAHPRAQAVAIRNGRVIAVGSEGKVRAAVTGRAEGINLNGRALIPALTDAHVHLIAHALARRNVRLDDAATLDDALQQIGVAAERLPAGAWVQGRGWDHSRWGRWPTAADLDAVIGDRPAYFSRKDGHSAWVSSAALRLAGITAETPDPVGGAIQRERGEPTGILLETAIDLVRRHIPEPGQEERLAAVREAIEEAHSYGMVGMHLPTSMTPGDGRMTLDDLQTLRERGHLQLRCLVYLGLDGLDAALALGLHSGLGDRWIRLGGIKMFADGSLGSQTADMLAPYEGSSNRGIAVLSSGELRHAVRRAIHGGLAVMVHAIGDAANRKVLDAIEAALPGAPPLSIPNRIEHCQVVHPDDLPRFARLGVIASMQPIHCTADMEVADVLWGKRCAYAYAWRSFLDAGATLAFGSDAPVESLNPWLSVHAAVTRQRPEGTPDGGWYSEQRLTVEEALRGFCYGCAVAAGAAAEQGVIAPGMLADFAILSADPFKLDPSALHTIRAEMTILEGKVVWEQERL
ncbi:Amidohydrolase 3 [Roseiflexus castenholzii DSM 13941]|uniref:Amidohydrolase 3 n=2 Tax=Roseiflexus castenholzii TaxID=120962 RepID=A7NQM4_ROSCS|nr:Amidohydrolase 3 [Roseiflexus castenholzii DSM 13941]